LWKSRYNKYRESLITHKRLKAFDSNLVGRGSTLFYTILDVYYYGTSSETHHDGGHHFCKKPYLCNSSRYKVKILKADYNGHNYHHQILKYAIFQNQRRQQPPFCGKRDKSISQGKSEMLAFGTETKDITHQSSLSQPGISGAGEIQHEAATIFIFC